MWGKTHGRCLIMQTLIDDTSINHTCPNSIALMSTEQTYQVIPKIQFQVLIIGRANAGKTLILQQFCDTMEIPTIYRWEENGRKEEVHGPKFVCESDLTADQVTLDSLTCQWMLVIIILLFVCPLALTWTWHSARQAHHQR